MFYAFENAGKRNFGFLFSLQFHTRKPLVFLRQFI
jgi:hypothetical protein